MGGAASAPPTQYEGDGPGPAIASSGRAAPRTVLHEEATRPLAGWFVVLRSTNVPAYKEIPVFQGRNVIGRSPALGVQSLPDAKASSEHCRILANEHGVEIMDLDSANGTKVNNQRVRNVQLQKGDMVRLGSTTMVYVPLPERRI
jgi:hypothetical protein